MTNAGKSIFPPLILAVAPNGVRKTKRDHENLPVTAAEIANAAATCRDAGAAMIHLHVRNRDGGHCLDVSAYRDAIDAIRRTAGSQMIIQPTSESGGIYEPAQQMAMVRELRPETVSLALREIMPDATHEPDGAVFFGWLRKARITPQYILYTPDEVTRYHDLVRRGIIPGDRHYLLYVIGRYDSEPDPEKLEDFLRSDDSPRPWMVCAFGAAEAAIVSAAAAAGGHARVGFENNLRLSDGTTAPDNAALVQQARASCQMIGRPVASTDEARATLLAD